MEAIRAAARRREADAVRDLLRHRARDRVRARLPAARRAADPRLASSTPTTATRSSPSTFRAMGPTLRSLCPATCDGISADPAGDLGQLVAQLRAQAAAGVRLRRARPLAPGHDRPARAAGPDVRHRLHPAAARARADRRPRRAGRRRRAAGAPDPRVSALDELGSPRDFSTARYATVCETTPLPWDPGHADRPAAARSPQQRIAALPAGAFAPFDAAGRGRGRDRPLPALAGRPARRPRPPRRAVSHRADADPPGRRGPAHAAGVVGRTSPPASRARSGFVDPRHRALDGQRPARLRRRRDPALRPRRQAADALQADPHRRAGGRSRARSRSSRSPACPGYSRKVGRTLRASRPPPDDLLLILSPAHLRAAAAACAAARGRSRGDRLVLRDYQAVTGVT